METDRMRRSTVPVGGVFECITFTSQLSVLLAQITSPTNFTFCLFVPLEARQHTDGCQVEVNVFYCHV